MRRMLTLKEVVDAAEGGGELETVDKTLLTVEGTNIKPNVFGVIKVNGIYLSSIYVNPEGSDPTVGEIKFNGKKLTNFAVVELASYQFVDELYVGEANLLIFTA